MGRGGDRVEGRRRWGEGGRDRVGGRRMWGEGEIEWKGGEGGERER